MDSAHPAWVKAIAVQGDAAAHAGPDAAAWQAWLDNRAALPAIDKTPDTEISDRFLALLGFTEAQSQRRTVRWTSGGTEAAAHALAAALYAQRNSSDGYKTHVLTSHLEHPAVGATLQAWADADQIELERLRPNAWGEIEAASVAQAMRPHTGLVSIMAGHNETGVCQPLQEIGQVCRQHKVLCHTDAVQMPEDLAEVAKDWDFITCSGHKLGGLGGIGAGVMSKGYAAKLWDAVPWPTFVAGALVRAWLAGFEVHALHRSHLRALQVYFESEVLTRMPGVQVLGSQAQRRLPGITALAALGCLGEGVQMGLDVRGVAVGCGSACRSGTVEPSPGLRAWGLSRAEAKEVVRFSWGIHTQHADVDAVLEMLVPLVAQLRAEATSVTAV